jgi:hypothetical protein
MNMTRTAAAVAAYDRACTAERRSLAALLRARRPALRRSVYLTARRRGWPVPRAIAAGLYSAVYAGK